MSDSSKILEELQEKAKLLLWYKDVSIFFKDVFGSEPYPYQKKVLEELKDPNIHRVLITASGGSGKTKLVACHALWLAIPFALQENRSVSIVIISGSQNQARTLYGYIKEGIENSPLLQKYVDGEITQSFTKFKNGSSVSAVPNSQKAIQSLHKDVVIIDEPCLAGDFVIDDAKRIVVKDNSLDKIILLGTPFVPPESKVKSTKFIDMYMDKEKFPEWKRYHWNAMDCPNVTAEQIEEAKRTLSEEMFSIFWLGEPYFVGESLIPFDQLKEASLDVKTQYDPNYPAIAGIDWGYKHETSLTIAQKRDDIWYVIYNEGWRLTEYEDLQEKVYHICKQFNVEVIYADAEAIGENQRLESKGLRVVPIPFVKYRTQLQANLQVLFAKRRIRIDENMIKLKEQLRKYNWDVKINDDRVDSLMLAVNNIFDEESSNIPLLRIL